MGLKRVFKKIGAAILKVGKIIADVNDVPFVNEVIAFIPMVGPALSIAMSFVDRAEKAFPKPKSGKLKLAWALKQTEEALAAAGLKEKRLNALIEIALLIIKGEAKLVEAEGN